MDMLSDLLIFLKNLLQPTILLGVVWSAVIGLFLYLFFKEDRQWYAQHRFTHPIFPENKKITAKLTPLQISGIVFPILITVPLLDFLEKLPSLMDTIFSLGMIALLFQTKKVYLLRKKIDELKKKTNKKDNKKIV